MLKSPTVNPGIWNPLGYPAVHLCGVSDGHGGIARWPWETEGGMGSREDTLLLFPFPFPLGCMWGGQGHLGHLEGSGGNWGVLGATDGPKGEAMMSWGQLG